MAKKKTPPPSDSPASPKSFETTLGGNGAAVKGKLLTHDQAVKRREAGQNVVVCGDAL